MPYFVLFGAMAFGIEAAKAADDTQMAQQVARQSFEFNRSNGVLGLRFFEALKITNSYPGMVALASSCRQIPGLATNVTFLAEVLFAAHSRNPAPLLSSEKISIASRIRSGKMQPNENSTIIRQDIFIQGGRAVWLLEQLLSRSLPEISETTNEDEYKDVLLDIHYIIRETLLPSEAPRSISGLSAEQKRRLATAADSNEVIFWKLANDEDQDIRRLVAANRETPVHVLGKLADRDKDEEVRKLASKNLEHARSFSK